MTLFHQWPIYPIITYTHSAAGNLPIKSKQWPTNLVIDNLHAALALVGHCLYSNQSFYKQVVGYWMGVGDHRVAQYERGPWANKIAAV